MILAMKDLLKKGSLKTFKGIFSQITYFQYLGIKNVTIFSIFASERGFIWKPVSRDSFLEPTHAVTKTPKRYFDALKEKKAEKERV